MVWKIEQPYKPESKKVVWEVAPYLRGRGLDIGAGSFKVLPQVISVDNGTDNVLFGIPFNPDVRVNTAEDLSIFGNSAFDFVYSSHLLEHLVDPFKALKEWWRVLKLGGVLVLYLPHEDLYPKIGEPGANADHKHNLNETMIIEWMMRVGGWDLERNEQRNEDDEYSFLMIFRKLEGKKRANSYQKPKPAKSCCVVRYGAFGDMIQTSTVIAGLKKQGYHVTVFASPPGSDVIAHDPNIDKMVLFDKDQVPNSDLGNFWDWQKRHFDKWVNLSESVEGSLLALPGRAAHGWTPLARHTLMNRNYVEIMHQIADVPHEPKIKFYALPEEKSWAKKQRDSIKYKTLVMWSLAGSSVHKTWAGLDNIMASILVNYPDAAIMLVGGPECEILEGGWENEPRVFRTCGKFGIRATFSMLEQVDLLIGPETGVMNAACCMDMPKVVFLSHSTHENLTRDWKSVYPLWSKNTHCPGRGDNVVPACHCMHYGFDHCKRDEASGVAQCMADLKIADVWEVVDGLLQEITAQRRKQA